MVLRGGGGYTKVGMHPTQERAGLLGGAAIRLVEEAFAALL